MSEQAGPPQSQDADDFIREDYKAMAKDIQTVGDQIIRDAVPFLDDTALYETGLHWFFHDDKSKPAQALQATADKGEVSAGGILLDFSLLTLEENLKNQYGSGPDSIDNLTLDVAKRLGFFEAQATKEEIKKDLEVAPNKQYEHPSKPFKAQFTANRDKKLIGLTIFHK